MRRFRFLRFSLLTLLFLTAIAALSITVIILWREVGPLRIENKRLHEERGTLMVLERRRLQATSPNVVEASYSIPEPDHPLDGLLLWIEHDPGKE